jgi:hypothetical protein
MESGNTLLARILVLVVSAIGITVAWAANRLEHRNT